MADACHLFGYSLQAMPVMVNSLRLAPWLILRTTQLLRRSIEAVNSIFLQRKGRNCHGEKTKEVRQSTTILDQGQPGLQMEPHGWLIHAQWHNMLYSKREFLWASGMLRCSFNRVHGVENQEKTRRLLRYHVLRSGQDASHRRRIIFCRQSLIHPLSTTSGNVELLRRHRSKPPHFNVYDVTIHASNGMSSDWEEVGGGWWYDHEWKLVHMPWIWGNLWNNIGLWRNLFLLK